MTPRKPGRTHNRYNLTDMTSFARIIKQTFDNTWPTNFIIRAARETAASYVCASLPHLAKWPKRHGKMGFETKAHAYLGSLTMCSRTLMGLCFGSGMVPRTPFQDASDVYLAHEVNNG